MRWLAECQEDEMNNVQEVLAGRQQEAAGKYYKNKDEYTMIMTSSKPQRGVYHEELGRKEEMEGGIRRGSKGAKEQGCKWNSGVGLGERDLKKRERRD
jgi:hypothetical protein